MNDVERKVALAAYERADSLAGAGAYRVTDILGLSLMPAKANGPSGRTHYFLIRMGEQGRVWSFEFTRRPGADMLDLVSLSGDMDAFQKDIALLRMEVTA